MANNINQNHLNHMPFEVIGKLKKIIYMDIDDDGSNDTIQKSANLFANNGYATTFVFARNSYLNEELLAYFKENKLEYTAIDKDYQVVVNSNNTNIFKELFQFGLQLRLISNDFFLAYSGKVKIDVIQKRKTYIKIFRIKRTRLAIRFSGTGICSWIDYDGLGMFILKS